MLKNNYFQYERINEELKQYNLNFTIESMVKLENNISVKGYGFRYKNEIYHIVRELNGKYRICKLKNNKIYGTYSKDLSLKLLRISLKNMFTSEE